MSFKVSKTGEVSKLAKEKDNLSDPKYVPYTFRICLIYVPYL